MFHFVPWMNPEFVSLWIQFGMPNKKWHESFETRQEKCQKLKRKSKNAVSDNLMKIIGFSVVLKVLIIMAFTDGFYKEKIRKLLSFLSVSLSSSTRFPSVRVNVKSFESCCCVTPLKYRWYTFTSNSDIKIKHWKHLLLVGLQLGYFY